MFKELHWKTVSETLAEVLKKMMKIREFSGFRLVGGTSLCLQLGHRESYDIDMFTDMDYGSVDFKKIDKILRKQFRYVNEGPVDVFSMGLVRLVGKSISSFVKIDMFNTDPFIRDCIETEGIRMATIEDIAAMKLEVISVGGRKRDFWDIGELLEVYELDYLIKIFRERYPYHQVDDVLNGLTNFTEADEERDPTCLRGKFWDLIKYDFQETVKEYRASH